MSLPNPPKGGPLPRKEPANRLDPGKGQGKPLPLRFSYYSVMRPQEVFPLTVQVREGAAAVLANAGSLTIKPSIPGALVEPREQVLDASKPNNSVTFQVAPVAKGKLPNASVQVLQQNQVLQSFGLGMKTKTQRLTWLLVLLTLVLPYLVTYVTRDHPLKGTIPRQAKPRSESALAANQPKDDAKEAANKDNAKPDDAKQGGAVAGRQQPGRGPGGGQPRGGGPRPPAPPAEPAAGPQPTYEQFGATPGIYLEYVVKKSIFDVMPHVDYVFDSDPATVLDNKPSDGLSWFAWGIGQVYELMCNTTSLGAIVLAALLGLTTLSWVTHRKRRRNLNKVVMLAAEPRLEGRHPTSGRVGSHEQVIPVADPAD